MSEQPVLDDASFSQPSEVVGRDSEPAQRNNEPGKAKNPRLGLVADRESESTVILVHATQGYGRLVTLSLRHAEENCKKA